MDTPTTLVPHIPGYTPSRLLGRGASSEVWLASRDKDGIRFAIKCMPDIPGTDSTSSEGRRDERILREARLLSTLTHEHLVRTHCIVELGGTSQGGLGMVMDYAAGGSLANLVGGRGKLGVGETVTILTPIAQVLSYLHSRGTAHGDISPGNVLFTAQGKPLVADLGVAGMLGEKNQNLDVGTPGFMASAVSGAGGQSDEESLQLERDVYSMAALGWYCLTGVAPEHASHRPPLSLLVPDVPKALAAALEMGLDPDPQARPTARELGSAIYRSAAPEPVDLAGSVHPSVIPELLTRRQAGGRSRRGTGPLGALSRIVPSRRTVRRRPMRRETRKKATALAAIRSVVILTAGVLAGSVACAVWLESREPASELTASPGVGKTMVRAQALPEELAASLREDDPAMAVPALSAVRDMALGLQRPGLLALVNAPGSPAEAADSALGQQLQIDGIRFTGLTTTLSGLSVVDAPDADHAVVALTAATSGYEERDPTNRVVRSQPAGKPQELRLILVRSDGQWRISEIAGPG